MMMAFFLKGKLQSVAIQFVKGVKTKPLSLFIQSANRRPFITHFVHTPLRLKRRILLGLPLSCKSVKQKSTRGWVNSYYPPTHNIAFDILQSPSNSDKTPYMLPYSLVFLEVVLFSKFRRFLVALRGEVPFPARAEVDVPTPELT
jgi:hypothetical protein